MDQSFNVNILELIGEVAVCLSFVENESVVSAHLEALLDTVPFQKTAAIWVSTAKIDVTTVVTANLRYCLQVIAQCVN